MEKARNAQSLTVLYDGGCPLCRAEIGHYKSRTGEQIAYADIHANPDAASAYGIPPENALKRFHVVREDGRVFSGARAFAEVWKRTPGWRSAGRLASLPPFVWAGELLYRMFLWARPLWRR